MPEIIIALTFDGGPDGAVSGDFPDKQYNTTEHVLRTLRAPGIEGVANVKAAFFVQTHVPLRMARIDGSLGDAEANYTHGQELVKRMGKEGHVVGLLSGSEKDLHRHDLQLEGEKLEANLERGVDALKPLMPLLPDGTPRPVEFVRGPFGFTTNECKDIYVKPKIALGHVYWDFRPCELPPGDFCPGVPSEFRVPPPPPKDPKKEIPIDNKPKLTVLKEGIQKRRAAIRKKKDDSINYLVVQLYDIAETTAAQLRSILKTLRDEEGDSVKPEVPVRFCATADEVAAALRAVAPPKYKNFNLPDLKKFPYEVTPRLARIYGKSVQDNLLAWDLVKTEGWVNHLYLDDADKPIPTAGVGSNVKADEALLSLDLKKDGTPPVPASDPEKLAARKAMTDVASTRPGKKECLKLSKLILLEEDTEKRLNQDLPKHVAELDPVLADFGALPFSKFPLPARLALADMIFNLGAGSFAHKDKKGKLVRATGLRQFREFFKAINAADWKKAAKHCRRDKDRNLGVIKRNDATADLFFALDTLLDSAQPLSIETAPSAQIVHTADGTPSIPDLPITLILEKGWSLVGPIRWSVSIQYMLRDRFDTATLPPGLSNTLSWTIKFGPVVRGGLLQLDISADVRHADGRTLALHFTPQGTVTAQNPVARDVRLALEAELQPHPSLPGFLFKALAYHASTERGGQKREIAFRPFTNTREAPSEGRPLQPPAPPDKPPLPFYGLMRLPVRTAEPDCLWNWKKQIAASKERLAACINRVEEDQKSNPTVALTMSQFRQQVLHYYGQALSPDDPAATSYWTPKPPGNQWREVNAKLGSYTTAVMALIKAAEEGPLPEAWDI